MGTACVCSGLCKESSTSEASFSAYLIYKSPARDSQSLFGLSLSNLSISVIISTPFLIMN